MTARLIVTDTFTIVMIVIVAMRLQIRQVLCSAQPAFPGQTRQSLLRGQRRDVWSHLGACNVRSMQVRQQAEVRYWGALL